MTLMTYTGGDVMVFTSRRIDGQHIIESSALSDDELLKLHTLRTGVQHEQH